MHAKIVGGYAFRKWTFDVYLGRSYDGTNWIDAPNTNIKVVFKITPVCAPVLTRVTPPVLPVPQRARVLPPVPVFTPPVSTGPEGDKVLSPVPIFTPSAPPMPVGKKRKA